MRRIPTQLLIAIWSAFVLAPLSSFADDFDPYLTVNRRGVVGETDHLGLVQSGLLLHPYYNDYAGNTDKYLTHATTGSVIIPRPSFSLQIGINWRFITPNMWDRLELEDVPNQNTPFADWITTSIAMRKPVNYGSLGYLQFEYELGVFGDHNADKLQRKMHGAIRRYSEVQIQRNEYWTDRYRGRGDVIGIELGTASSTANTTSSAKDTFNNFGIGYISSPLTNDLYIIGEYQNRASTIYWSLQSRLVRQFSAKVYRGSLNIARLDVTIAFRILDWLVPSIKVVSPIFRNDRKHQVYVDLLTLNYSF